ncbi:MAG: hypothetical protein JST28_18760 [Acidobacteria bacterium]|nr:hypothetical protein [Acidobacteriota bacterium]
MNARAFKFLACFFASCGLVPQPGFASDYVQRRAAASRHCETINPSDYQSGLAFNPDGYRSFYVQSECFQNAAVQFRDAPMCDRVRRRWSLLSSSWGISPSHCRELVSDGMKADRAEIETEKRRYHSGQLKLRNFQIRRNGNGRDFDILPDFTTGYPHGYTLTFEILGVRDQPVLLHSNGYYLDQNSRLNLFVRQSEIRARFPEFQTDHPYKVRATVTLSMGKGGMSGYWSDEFLESIFPAATRSKTLAIDIRF